MRRSPRSWAASPPPKPSPIEGEGSKERTTCIVTTPTGPRLAAVRPVCYTARLNQIRTPWWPLSQTPAPQTEEKPGSLVVLALLAPLVGEAAGLLGAIFRLVLEA